jgi:hypothetical protein
METRAVLRGQRADLPGNGAVDLAPQGSECRGGMDRDAPARSCRGMGDDRVCHPGEPAGGSSVPGARRRRSGDAVLLGTRGRRRRRRGAMGPPGSRGRRRMDGTSPLSARTGQPGERRRGLPETARVQTRDRFGGRRRTGPRPVLCSGTHRSVLGQDRFARRGPVGVRSRRSRGELVRPDLDRRRLVAGRPRSGPSLRDRSAGRVVAKGVDPSRRLPSGQGQPGRRAGRDRAPSVRHPGERHRRSARSMGQ